MTTVDPNEAVRHTSWQNRAHVAASRLLGRVLGNGEWATRLIAKRARRSAAEGRSPSDGAPPRRAVRGLDVSRSNHGGWPVWTLRHRTGAPPARVIVYFHGGGYLGQITAMQYRWCAEVARRTGAAVIVPIYPLAPIGTASTVVPVAANFIASVVADNSAGSVSVAGDSAGGGLALAAAQDLVRRAGPLPARLVLISPWLDLTISDPASADIDVPAAGTELLRAGGRLWAGGADPADPPASPLFGPLAGLPPIVLFGGTFDVLHPDTVRLAQRAHSEGVAVNTVIRDGLGHVWPLYAHLPEARAIRPQLHRALIGEPL